VRAALAFLGSESNLTRISAGCFSDNHACRRMLEKSEMRHLGTQRRFWLKGDAWKDGEMFEYIFESTAGSGRD
jgi:RimJ/RimL family protein N-acetyltransferase